MKLGEILNPDFRKVLMEIAGQPIPAIASYKVAVMLESVDKEVKRYHAARQLLLEKHVQRDEDGKLKTNADSTEYLIKDMEAFTADHEALMSVEVEEPVSKLSLNDIKDLKLSPKSMQSLLPVISPLSAI